MYNFILSPFYFGWRSLKKRQASLVTWNIEVSGGLSLAHSKAHTPQKRRHLKLKGIQILKHV